MRASNRPRSRFVFVSAVLAAMALAACTTADLVRVGIPLLQDLWGAVQVNDQTTTFREHWEILNDDRLPHPSRLKHQDAEKLARDLSELSEPLIDAIRKLESEQKVFQDTRFHKQLRQFPDVEIRVVPQLAPLARTKQDSRKPVIEISSGLLAILLNRSEAKMRRQMAEVDREFGKRLSKDDLFVETMDRAKIPVALEYRDSLTFLLAHELVHAWLDEPVTSDTDIRAIETRADGVGLLLTSQVSYIVKTRQKNEGLNNLVLNRGSAPAFERAALFAESGPEFFFSANQAMFISNSGNYRTREERITDAKTFMQESVYKGVYTSLGTYIRYFLSGAR